MAITATLVFEEGCTILSYDGPNVFNSIYRHRFLPALAEIDPSVVPYVSNLYAREPPKLLFALDGGGSKVVESARGVQQGSSLGPLCYSTCSLKILEEFRVNPPVLEARAVLFVHRYHGYSTTGTFPRYGDRESYGMASGTPRGRSHLVERKEIETLLADGVGSEHLTEEQRVAIDSTGLAVVRHELRVIRVPVGT